MSKIIDLFSGIDLDKVTARREVEEASDFASQVINASSEGILVLDRQLRYTVWNKKMEDLTGLEAADVLGCYTFDVVPATREIGLDKIYERVFNGETIELEYPSPTPIHGVHGIRRSTFHPIRDEMGRITSLLAIICDVTLIAALRAEIEQRKRAESRLQFLSDAGIVLSSTLDYDATLKQALRLATEHFDGWCTLRVLRDGTLQRIVVHKDPELVRLVERIEDEYPDRYSSLDSFLSPTRVMQTQKSTFIPVITDEMTRTNSKDERHYRMAKTIGLTSYICAPLLADTECLGTLTLFSKRIHFCEEDLMTAEDLARRFGLAIKNAILYEKCKQLASTSG